MRGTRDVLPAEWESTRNTVDGLAANAMAHGYRFIETPILEHTELFLRKSGGDRVAQLYSFTHRGRDLALRPEFTASAVRVFVERMQSEPLPVRLAMTGPVFRYEKPQAGRSRQFTEFGCELIGASGPVADAEIVGLALEGLRLAGVERPRVVLGHIGVVISFLAGLDIDQRAQDWLTWSMERLRKGDEAAHDLPPHLARVEAARDDDAAASLPDDGVTPEAIAAILRQAGVEFQGGVREPEEIVGGLIAKRRRRHDAALLRDAAAFVERLTELTGPPDAVMQPLRELVAAHGLPAAPLDELEEIVSLLAATGMHPDHVTIDLGMGRGLHYYTGMLFEVYAGADGSPQLCGGGRYDDLAQILGARQPVPACGFSYGVERLMDSGSPIAGTVAQRRVLVRQNGDPSRAMLLASELRGAGWIASVDLRNRNQSATRRAAERQGYDAIASVVDGKTEFLHLSRGDVAAFADTPKPGPTS
ncbi:MAG TPA: ATP phosphoribosyltransferase regulatory subunit [Thermomicrobiales bacterium]|nr:ATP phosphoribosyltransferase regulatory subunit [Thermomicrobiales bacterium]